MIQKNWYFYDSILRGKVIDLSGCTIARHLFKLND